MGDKDITSNGAVGVGYVLVDTVLDLAVGTINVGSKFILRLVYVAVGINDAK